MRYIEINKEWNDRQPFIGVSYLQEESSLFILTTGAYIKHKEWLAQFEDPINEFTSLLPNITITNEQE
jgi:hypothetical protein